MKKFVYSIFALSYSFLEPPWIQQKTYKYLEIRAKIKTFGTEK